MRRNYIIAAAVNILHIMRKKQIISNSVLYIALTCMLIVTVFPLVYTILASFKSNAEILTNPGSMLPKNPTLSNYVQALTSESFHVPTLLRNSIIYTLVNVFTSLLISSMAGYVFARGHFKFKKIIFYCFTALMFIKTGGITIYATFKILSAVHLDRSLIALMIVHLFSVPIVNIYLIKGNIETIPTAIDEAAKIDGCSFIGVFFQIILPLIKPILATVAILAFNRSWNDYLMPNIFTLTTPNQRTLIVGLMALKSSGESAASWNLMLAGASIAILPVLVAFAFCNKYFVKGIAAGAVKG